MARTYRLAMLEAGHDEWTPAVRAEARTLLRRRAGVAGRRPATGAGPRGGIKSRHHGNFDLGQVLVVQNDFAIVDLEPEHRDDRPEKFDSPLRDAASLLHSIAYVAETALERARGRRPDDEALLARATANWRSLARRHFLAAYEAGISGSRIGPPSGARLAWLQMFELERSLRDVRSHVDRRPESLHIMLRSLLSALSASGANGGRAKPTGRSHRPSATARSRGAGPPRRRS